MAEMASVASVDDGKPGADCAAASSSLCERFGCNPRGGSSSSSSHANNPKRVEFADNILVNHMGPPPALCSALLLTANAACRPSSRCSDAPSDVVAHVDTVRRDSSFGFWRVVPRIVPFFGKSHSTTTRYADG